MGPIQGIDYLVDAEDGPQPRQGTTYTLAEIQEAWEAKRRAAAADPNSQSDPEDLP